MTAPPKPTSKSGSSLSTRFMVSSIVAGSLVSFLLGRFSQHLSPSQFYHHAAEQRRTESDLPRPRVKGKHVPVTIYTAKNFDTRLSVLSSQWLEAEDDGVSAAPKNEKLTEYNETGSIAEFEDDEEHLPAGQHLLVDMDGVDFDFLNSEKRLATAMIDMVDSSGLTLLSYHCHGLSPVGVSCVGVLLESHVSFHTWPVEGVITLDLFTCGETSLLSSVKLIENLFAVPKSSNSNNKESTPQVLWAYKRRGFKEQSGLNGQRDTFAYPLGLHGMEEKREIANSQTSSGKEIWIYDLPQLKRSNPAIDRMLFVDGVLRSSQTIEAAVYESFIHPTLFAHPHPKNVAVLGAGIGVAAREVLKHKSIENVVLVGTDDNLMRFTKEHLPAATDCAFLQGINSSCLDDARVSTVATDPVSWTSTHPAAMDVAFVDFFDMEEEVSKEILESPGPFFEKVYNLLVDDGLASIQLSGPARSGDAPVSSDSGARVTQRQDHHTNMKEVLRQAGFVALREYEENQLGFPEPRKYIVAFKNEASVSEWEQSESQVEVKIQRRSVMPESGKSPFRFFDGATMDGYSGLGTRQGAAAECGEWCETNAQLKNTLVQSNNVGSFLETRLLEENASIPNKDDYCSETGSQNSCQWVDPVVASHQEISP